MANFYGWNLERLYNGFYYLINSDFGIESNDLDKPALLLKKIGNVYNDKLGALIHYGVPLSNSDPIPVIRIVKWDFPPTEIKKCSYNEECYMSRFNFSKNPIFYGAETFDTAYQEMELRKGDKFVAGNWSFNINNTIAYSMFFNHPNNTQFKKFFDRLNNYAKKNYSGNDLILHEHLYKINTQLMLSPNYYISSYIAYNYLYHKEKPTEDITKRWLLYPSLKTYQKTFNIAINKILADSSNLIPIQFSYCEVINKEKQYDILQIGTPNKNGINIDWVPFKNK